MNAMLSPPAPPSASSWAFPRKDPATNSALNGPVPLPNRPKGRWFFTVIVMTIVGTVGYQLWNTFIRHRALGVVEGRTVQISPQSDGPLRYVHVREGETVRAGQVLLTVDDFELRHREDQITCEIKTAQSNLEAEAARLRWQASFTDNQAKKAETERFEIEGRLLVTLAQVDLLRNEVNRARALDRSNASSAQELDQLTSQLQGQEDNAAQLKLALAASRQRSDSSRDLLSKGNNLKAGIEEAGLDQLKPFLTRIQSLQVELGWIHRRLESAKVRAPIGGTIIKLQKQVGEFCKPGEPVLTLLEDESLQIALYMPQHGTAALPVGSEMGIRVEPYSEPIRCKVVRHGTTFEPAPRAIERHYSANEQLLPVYLRPDPGAERRVALRIGAVATLPRSEAVHFNGGSQ